MRLRLVGVALLAGTLAACDDPAGPAPAPNASAGPAVDGVDHPVVVSGSGHIEAGDGLRNFTFHAVRHPDGSASGSYRIARTDLGTSFTVDVTCLTVVGNQAWLAGRIASADGGGVLPGTISYFYAIDNGEGSDAPADIVSLARINDREGEDLLFCAELPTGLPPRNVQLGNVQIR